MEWAIASDRRCFLDDDYHHVTTRQIAAEADTSVSMIRYYFGNKEIASDDIAKTLTLHADYLYRLLRMLASIGMFEECAPRQFRNDYLDDFDWGRFERLIDVGGSNGRKALAILRQNPGLTALVFDRPQVIENAAADWRGRIADELLARVTFCGGDMLREIPAATSNGDVYLFVAIFHGMNDDDAEKALFSMRRACGPYHPTIVIVDCVAEAQGIDPKVASFDMQMLIGTHGRERTEAEWLALFERSGFALEEIVVLRTFSRLLVIKPITHT